MMGLSGGRKSFPIGLAVLIQYRSVTASQPASQPPSHVAVAITLNAKASSLKTLLSSFRKQMQPSFLHVQTLLHFLKVSKRQWIYSNVSRFKGDLKQYTCVW